MHVLQPIRVTACYWKVKQAGEFSSSSFPCFIDSRSVRGEGHDVYSLPAEEYPGLIKVFTKINKIVFHTCSIFPFDLKMTKNVDR